MFLNVATTVTLIASCLGQEKLYDENTANKAISTQSFNRDDIPISYKYSAIHVYPTQNPKNDDVIRPKKNKKKEFHTIQYAPLYNEDKSTTNSRYTKVILDPNTEKEVVSKEKLEPRRQPSRISDIPSYRYYVPGHNIKISRSPNRYGGHNAVYRSDPDNFKGPHDKANSVQDYVNHQITETGNEYTKPIRPSKNLKHEPLTWMFKHIKRPSTYVFHKGESSNTPPNNIHPLPTHHTHRMRINVARLNGHAQVIAKEIVIGDISKNYGKPQSKVNLKGAMSPYSEMRTYLYPTKTHQTYQNLS